MKNKIIYIILGIILFIAVVCAGVFLFINNKDEESDNSKKAETQIENSEKSSKKNTKNKSNTTNSNHEKDKDTDDDNDSKSTSATNEKLETILDDDNFLIKIDKFDTRNKRYKLDITNKTDKKLKIFFERASLNMGMSQSSGVITLEPEERDDNYQFDFSYFFFETGLEPEDVTAFQTDLYVYELGDDPYDVYTELYEFERNKTEPYAIYKKIKTKNDGNFETPEVETNAGAMEIVNNDILEFQIAKQACVSDLHHCMKFYLKNHDKNKDIKIKIITDTINGTYYNVENEHILSANGGYIFIEDYYNLGGRALEDVENENDIKTVKITYIVTDADNENDVLMQDTLDIELNHETQYRIDKF